MLVEEKRSSAATLKSARIVQQPAVLQFPVANSPNNKTEVEEMLLASGHVAAVSKKTRILKSHPKRSKFLRKQEQNELAR